MKVDFDGLRGNATSDLNRLSSLLSEHVIDNSDIDEWDTEEIVNSFNSLAQSVGIFNCIYQEDIGLNDLSDKLSVNFLDDGN